MSSIISQICFDCGNVLDNHSAGKNKCPRWETAETPSSRAQRETISSSPARPPETKMVPSFEIAVDLDQSGSFSTSASVISIHFILLNPYIKVMKNMNLYDPKDLH
jgi:hypothetical protein